MLNLKLLLKSSFLVVAGFGLVKCAPVGTPVGLDQQLTTGGTTVVTNPYTQQPTSTFYTVAGQQNSLNKIAKHLGQEADKALAQSIKKVKIKLLDKNGDPTSEKPIQLKAHLILSGKYNTELTFQRKIYQKDKSLPYTKGTMTSSNANSAITFSADFICKNESCQSIEVYLTTTSKDSTGQAYLSKAGLVYTYSQPKLRIKKPKKLADQKYQSISLHKLETLKPEQMTVKRETIVVLDGQAYSQITVNEKKENQSITKEEEEEAPIFQAEVPLTDTADTVAMIEKIELDKGNTDISGELIGNNPKTGSIAIDLHDQKESAVLVLEEEPQQTPQESPVKVNEPTKLKLPFTSESGAIFASPRSREESPEAYDITQRMLQIHNPEKGELARIIRIMQGKEDNAPNQCGAIFPSTNHKRVQNFLYHAQFISEALGNLYRSQDVSPKVANLMLVESGFLVSNSKDFLKIKNIVGGSGEVGPFQFMLGTAQHVRGKMLPKKTGYTFYKANPSSKISSKKDDRNYLIPSAQMAGTYMRHHFKGSHDPALAAFSYNRGAGNRNKDQKKALQHHGISEQENRLKSFDITLDELYGYRMVRKSSNSCHAIQYAYSFAAMFFISENPEKYGFDIPKLTDADQKMAEKIQKTFFNPSKKPAKDLVNTLQGM